MATMKYFCKWQGCKILMDSEGYCPKHKPLVDKKNTERQVKRKEAFKKAIRTNYNFYRTKRWREMRSKKLKECPCCIKCGNIAQDLHVDHIIPPRGNEDMFFDINNLQVLCEDCHREKTQKEIRDRKNKNKEDIKKWLSSFLR